MKSLLELTLIRTKFFKYNLKEGGNEIKKGIEFLEEIGYKKQLDEIKQEEENIEEIKVEIIRDALYQDNILIQILIRNEQSYIEVKKNISIKEKGYNKLEEVKEVLEKMNIEYYQKE